MLGHRVLTSDDYLAIFKRRGRLVLIPALLLPVIAFAITFLLTPKYISQTLVLIEQQKVPDDIVKPVITSDLDERLASMKEQILSRSRIQPIIERFGLYPGKTMDDRLELARKSIEIKPIKSEVARAGGLPGFFISFRADEPHTAQQVCGEIRSLFVGENLRARQQSAEGTTSFLEGQLAQAKSNLDQQDAKLAQFQRKYIGKLPGEESPNMNMLTSLNAQLDAATQALSRMEQDKAYQESMLAQLSHEATAVIAAKPIPDERLTQLALLQAQADELSTRYTPDFPDVITAHRKIDDLRREIARNPAQAAVPGVSRTPESANVQQLRAQVRASEQGINAKRAEQMQIQSSIRTYQERIQSSPLVEEQYKALTRDYQTAQKFYDDLLAKMNQSKMATDLEKRQQGEQFRVMDEPNLPESPAFPNRLLFLGGGLILGVGLGLGLVAYLEYRDTALRSDRDVFAFTKLPTLATIISIHDDDPLPGALASSAKSKKRERQADALSGARA